MEKGDKGSTMIRMGVNGWMFLLVPAYPCCPGSKAVKRSLFLLCPFPFSRYCSIHVSPIPFPTRRPLLLPVSLAKRSYLLDTLPREKWQPVATLVSRYQKGKTSLGLNEARGDGVLGCQWHQLGMQTICTSLQRDNHTNTPSLNFYRPDALPDAQPTVLMQWSM